MFQRCNHRGGHYLLLLAVSALLYLPNLGVPSLWDIDEGNNSVAAREMREAENWHIPTFNYQLRDDKPALLYWLQIFAYETFGVGEFGARLPSALAGTLAVLLTYELGRLMFSAAAGLLGGLALASTAMFCAAAHFANPDALLTACTVLTFCCFWRGLTRTGAVPFISVYASMGLAVLAKGPVGLVLPSTVAGLFLWWSGRLRLIWNRRLALGILAFLMVALPWYLWVAVDTKAQFLRGFFMKHNVDRFLHPMENHSGPVFYYLAALLVGFAPWSIFLGPSCWYVLKGNLASRPSEEGENAASPQRFLVCWIAVYFVFFSIAHTKLPNYILPIYPAIALLTGQFLVSWQRGLIQPPAWLMNLSLVSLAAVGVGTGLGLAVAGGVIPLAALRGRSLPGLETCAALGVVPVVGAMVAWWCGRRQSRIGVIVSVAVASVVFVGSLAARAGIAIDEQKAPRSLARMIKSEQTEREIRIAAYGYFQPSLVFYCGREVYSLGDENDAREFLRSPLQVYMVMPEAVWRTLASKLSAPCRLLGQHRDMYRQCEIVVVTNR